MTPTPTGRRIQESKQGTSLKEPATMQRNKRDAKTRSEKHRHPNSSPRRRSLSIGPPDEEKKRRNRAAKDSQTNGRRRKSGRSSPGIRRTREENPRERAGREGEEGRGDRHGENREGEEDEGGANQRSQTGHRKRGGEKTRGGRGEAVGNREQVQDCGIQERVRAKKEGRGVEESSRVQGKAAETDGREGGEREEGEAGGRRVLQEKVLYHRRGRQIL